MFVKVETVFIAPPRVAHNILLDNWASLDPRNFIVVIKGFTDGLIHPLINHFVF